MKKAELTPEQRALNKQKNAPIVARIEALQKERGLRTDAMCKGAGVTPSAFSQWRTGLTVASVEKVQQFADYFGVSFVWLFTGVQEAEKAAAPEGDGDLVEIVWRLKTASPEVRAAISQLLKAAAPPAAAPGAQSEQK